MQDDDIALYNACADLVSLAKKEAFPQHLLVRKRAGEWIGVRELCSQIGIAPGDLTPGVFATWLPDPMAREAYAVIVFYDDESKWSMAAHYHRARLLGGTSPIQSLREGATAISVFPSSPSGHVTPAGAGGVP